MPLVAEGARSAVGREGSFTGVLTYRLSRHRELGSNIKFPDVSEDR